MTKKHDHSKRSTQSPQHLNDATRAAPRSNDGRLGTAAKRSKTSGTSGGHSKKTSKPVAKRSGENFLSAGQTVAAVVFRALCESGDYQGISRQTRSEAQNDAVAHQASHAGHIVDVIMDQSGA